MNGCDWHHAGPLRWWALHAENCGDAEECRPATHLQAQANLPEQRDGWGADGPPSKAAKRRE